MVGEIHRYSHCIQQSQFHKNESRKHKKVDKFRVNAKKQDVIETIYGMSFYVFFLCKENMFFYKKKLRPTWGSNPRP